MSSSATEPGSKPTGERTALYRSLITFLTGNARARRSWAASPASRSHASRELDSDSPTHSGSRSWIVRIRLHLGPSAGCTTFQYPSACRLHALDPSVKIRPNPAPTGTVQRSPAPAFQSTVAEGPEVRNHSGDNV